MRSFAVMAFKCFAITCGEHYLIENFTSPPLINNFPTAAFDVYPIRVDRVGECTFDFSESSFKSVMSTVLNTLKLYYYECIILETVIKGISLVFVSCTWGLIVDINSEKRRMMILAILHCRFC